MAGWRYRKRCQVAVVVDAVRGRSSAHEAGDSWQAPPADTVEVEGLARVSGIAGAQAPDDGEQRSASRAQFFPADAKSASVGRSR